MASRQYSYQYETSPRKIKPDYSKPRKNAPQYNKPKKKTIAKTAKVKQEAKDNKKKEDMKAKNRLIFNTKLAVIAKCVILFAILFFMIFIIHLGI